MADPTSQSVTDHSISDDVISDSVFSDDDISRLFDGLTAYASVVLAVSGGADSVALMVLVRRWMDLVPDPPTITVATIDHGLRAGSQDEAQWVADRASALGLTHALKRWSGDKPTSGIQAAARSARYRVLVEIMTEHEMQAPAAIVTAHTLDDQAETVVMRLARGSGVDGLGAMADARALKGPGEPVMLVRPLLGVSKSKLVAFLKAKPHSWLEDPSNSSTDFERIRLRQAMPHLEALGVSQDALALSAARARRARTALDQNAFQFLDAHLALNNGAFADLALDAFLSQPDEIQIRALMRLLAAFGGASPNAQLSQIEALQARLGGVAAPPDTVTLGGCLISNQKGRLRIHREPGRMPLPDCEISPGVAVIWDQRFQIVVSPEEVNATHTLQVRALDAASFAALKGHLSSDFAGIPVAAAQTLPSFWREDQLVAVPTLNVGETMLAEICDHQPNQDAAFGKGSPSLGGSRQRDPKNGHGACRDPAKVVFIGLAGHRFGT